VSRALRTSGQDAALSWQGIQGKLNPRATYTAKSRSATALARPSATTMVTRSSVTRPRLCLTGPADANAPLAIPHRHSISKLREAASGQ